MRQRNLLRSVEDSSITISSHYKEVEVHLSSMEKEMLRRHYMRMCLNYQLYPTETCITLYHLHLQLRFQAQMYHHLRIGKYTLLHFVTTTTQLRQAAICFVPSQWR